ncbi:MAG: leucine--tRNA ligase [Bacteroidota bacterium]
MEYNFTEIEKKWREIWEKNRVYKTENTSAKPKFYVLDMFPYPSGAGLHVGHPLGYIASDIYARFKRQTGFNVLHPMGFDAYGLPAEQYAIQTGQHPLITTEKNITRYREQLNLLGFSYDWDREVRTCEPRYYKWTQWVFIRLFHSWYNHTSDKAEDISTLIAEFESNGNKSVDAACSDVTIFTAEQWKSFSETRQQEVLMSYRLTYLADTMVNWCPALGTVLANDEVVEGFSVRGGHPVERKLMKQWLLRITAYADRLLNSLEKLDWADAIKEIQRNWIGRSEGASVDFNIDGHDKILNIFTTRPDTIFGVSFMTLAPEHEFVSEITTPEYRDAVAKYIDEAKNRTERERIADVKRISGQFTGAYAIHPFTGKKIPIWIGDYVLAGYGTGAVMAVPAHDSRDYAFAKHFGLPITEVVSGGDISTESYDAKEGILINSDFINGLDVKTAIKTVNNRVEESGIGKRKINFRLRDAIFSRQRYWGEPFPVYYKENGMPYTLDESQLPLELPEVDAYLPTESGDPPLARAKNWKTKDGFALETNTMPGFAGSSAYYLRYMDPHNENALVSKEANDYWQNVDLYIGGAEHATGHLIYARFWNKFLFDLGIACKDEPFQKMINQGMIQGRSSFAYRIKGTNTFVSYKLKDNYDTTELHVDVNLVEDDILDTDRFRAWLPDYANAEFILENGKYYCGSGVEKMSKSLHNVLNPDDLVVRYGADTLRLYEMFLGPVEMHKPWDTKGIEGVFRFIRKLWRLFHDYENNLSVSDDEPTKEELKIIHKAIKKIRDDIERFSFNTAVSAFMICVNELSEQKCNKKKVLSELVILIAPFAPHIAEELWALLGNSDSVNLTAYPNHNEEFLTENTFSYPVSFNGKMRFLLDLPLDMTVADITKAALEAKESEKYLGGAAPKKVIVVPKKIINIVI